MKILKTYIVPDAQFKKIFSLFSSSATGGINGGKLGSVESVEYDNKTDLIDGWTHISLHGYRNGYTYTPVKKLLWDFNWHFAFNKKFPFIKIGFSLDSLKVSGSSSTTSRSVAL